MTQFGNIHSLNRAMFVDVTENHLFLLDGIKIGGKLDCFKESRAQLDLSDRGGHPVGDDEVGSKGHNFANSSLRFFTA
jgi:hypothetical protein